jgi:hypothetical protein
MNKKILCAYKSRVYARQGRVSANIYAKDAGKAFDKIKDATTVYNTQIAGGKWSGMLSYNPRNLPVYDMPAIGSYTPSGAHKCGIVLEGDTVPINSNSTTAALPILLSQTNRCFFIDIFNSDTTAMNWKIETSSPWIKLSKTSWQTATDERIWVSANWAEIPENKPMKDVLKIQVNDSLYTVRIDALKIKDIPSIEKIFVEDNGVISIEVENFATIKSAETTNWSLIQGLGRGSDAMGTFPVTISSFDTASLKNAPTLTYNIFATSTGKANLRVYCLPNHPINDNYKLRFAVSIDGSKPLILDVALKAAFNEDKNMEWRTNVLRNTSIKEVQIDIPQAGRHLLSITMVDPRVVIDKAEIVFGEKQKSYLGAPETLIK